MTASAFMSLPLHQASAPIGKLGGFCSFGVLLMFSIAFVAIFASTRVLCVCVHPRDASTWLLSLCSFPGRDFGLVTGKFDFIQLSRGVLTMSDTSTGPLGSFKMPCVCMTCPSGFRASLAHIMHLPYPVLHRQRRVKFVRV